MSLPAREQNKWQNHMTYGAKPANLCTDYGETEPTANIKPK